MRIVRSAKVIAICVGVVLAQSDSVWATMPKSVRAAHLYAGLAKAQWIALGHGPKIVYEVFDPNCPYCHLLFNELRPLIGPYKLTVRAVPVGYLSSTSMAKAATILTAKHPRRMFLYGERHYSFHHGMDIPLTIPSKRVRGILQHNIRLVSASAGYAIVPLLAYRTSDGQEKFVVGPPGRRKLKRIIATVRG